MNPCFEPAYARGAVLRRSRWLGRERLASAVREVLEEAIAKGGSTLRDYVDSRGEPGYFQLGYFVYGREGEPCKVCGSRIRSQRIGQRNSFYCPQCQK